jgi:hypothetical protein
MRDITDLERRLIEGVASRLPPLEASVLMTDLECAVVAHDAVPGARALFAIAGYERPSYKGQHSYPVEIRLLDADGAELTAVLYADENNRLYELEIIRWEEEAPLAPDASSARFY